MRRLRRRWAATGFHEGRPVAIAKGPLAWCAVARWWFFLGKRNAVAAIYPAEEGIEMSFVATNAGEPELELVPGVREALAAVQTLRGLRYSYHGGTRWRPPMGQPPDFNRIDRLTAKAENLRAQMEGRAPPPYPASAVWFCSAVMLREIDGRQIAQPLTMNVAATDRAEAVAALGVIARAGYPGWSMPSHRCIEVEADWLREALGLVPPTDSTPRTATERQQAGEG